MAREVVVPAPDNMNVIGHVKWKKGNTVYVIPIPHPTGMSHEALMSALGEGIRRRFYGWLVSRPERAENPVGFDPRDLTAREPGRDTLLRELVAAQQAGNVEEIMRIAATLARKVR